MTQTYQARYRLLIGEDWREPGELVPEAITWFRVDSLVHHGRLILVDVEDAELEAAVAKYSPELAEQILGAGHPVAATTAPAPYPPDPLAKLSDVIGDGSETEGDGEAEPQVGAEPDQPDHDEEDEQPAPAEQQKQAAPAKKAPAKKAAPRKRAPRKPK